MAYNLTNNLSYSQNLVLAAREEMDHLTGQLNETSILGIIRNQKRFVVHLVNSDQDLQVPSRSERSVYETASGRLLLAFMTDKERSNFLQSNGLPKAGTWPEATTSVDRIATLSKIRADELAITLSTTYIIGWQCPSQRGVVVASLSVFLSEIRCSAHRREEIVRVLRQSAQVINERLD